VTGIRRAGIGPLELEVLGELRTILYEPDRGARAVRPAHQGHHQAIAGSRRYVAVPVLVVSLVAVLGGAFAAGKLFDPTSGPKAGATDGPRIECHDQLKSNAAVTADQVRAFERDLKARLQRAGLGTGCYAFRDLDAVTRAA
jgi:hypothetical protein